jgi:hypothetical protein
MDNAIVESFDKISQIFDGFKKDFSVENWKMG